MSDAQNPHSAQDQERERVWEEAQQSGYEAGIAAGERAAEAQVQDRLQQLDQMVQSARDELQQWQRTSQSHFEASMRALLKSLCLAHIAREDGFYATLLQEVAAAFEAEQDALQIQVSGDFSEQVEHCPHVVVDPALPVHEIRVVSGPRIARISIDQLVERAMNSAAEQPPPDPEDQDVPV